MVTTLVQGWADGSYTNQGIILESTGKASSSAYAQCYSSDYGTASQRPRLEIQWHQEPQPTTRSYYFLGSQRVAMQTDNVVYYFHTDHLGSTSAMSNESGALVEGSVTRYLPYGGYRTAPGANLTDHGFTGHKHNDEVGLIYMRARFYVPGLGRFASADTLVPEPGDPQAFNRYAYVLGNPLRFSDPTGHCTMLGDDSNGLCVRELDGWPPRVQVVRGAKPDVVLLPIWSKMPVENPSALQWYGNTQWAFAHGKDNNYHNFAQGMHPGIDLIGGTGTPVYAGAYGTVLWPGGAYSPGRVDIRHGEAMLLIGHLADIQVSPGDTVNPDTLIGYIDPSQRHIHLEIVLEDDDGLYMTNPLPFMASSLQVELLKLAEVQGDSRVSFYVPESGTRRWQTPYDQPDLRRKAGWIFPQ